MLIKFDKIQSILKTNNIKITGAFHIGAHECEELSFYNKVGLDNDDIVWIDAIEAKVEQAKKKGILHIHQAVVTDKDNDEITFNVSNNIQSSSVLEFGTHLKEHPHVVFVEKLKLKSITVDTFFKNNNLNTSKYNFWNFDIQGAELMALKGAVESLQYVDVLYLEVNEKELYKNCGLVTDLDEFLCKYNFERVLTHITKHGWGDAIYIKKQM